MLDTVTDLLLLISQQTIVFVFDFWCFITKTLGKKEAKLYDNDAKINSPDLPYKTPKRVAVVFQYMGAIELDILVRQCVENRVECLFLHGNFVNHPSHDSISIIAHPGIKIVSSNNFSHDFLLDCLHQLNDSEPFTPEKIRKSLEPYEVPDLIIVIDVHGKGNVDLCGISPVLVGFSQICVVPSISDYLLGKSFRDYGECRQNFGK